MMMDNTEIVINYKNAKDKKKQIGILAELNACPRSKIEEILRVNGLRPGKARDKTPVKVRPVKDTAAARDVAERLAVQNLAEFNAEENGPDNAVPDKPVIVELADAQVILPEKVNYSFRNILQEFMDGAIEDEIRLYERQIQKLIAKKTRLERIYRDIAEYIGQEGI